MMPVDGRLFLLKVHAVVEARQVVRTDLKRRNEKPSHYAHAEIGRMALQYLNTGHWPEYKALAFAKIMATPRLRAEWDAEGLRYAALMAKRRPKAASFI
jgi:hypothetical protein